MVILACLLGCAPDAEGPVTTPWVAPDQPGAWDPGTFDASLVGTDGEALTVQVWYPARSTGGEAYAYDGLIRGLATEDTEVACEGTRPVVVFSHGHSAVRWQSIFLTEHLASHGFVVVAPDHRWNTAFDIDEDRLGEVLLRRPVDVRDSFDWVVSQGEGGPLEGCVDPDAGYAVVGQSFGGYTTHATAGAVLDVAASAAHCATSDDWLCATFAQVVAAESATEFDLADPRVWAAVPLTAAGYEVVLGGLSDITVPVLAMGGTRDSLTPMETQVRPAFEGLTQASPRYLGVLTDAGHFTFSNACDWLTAYEECNPPFLAPDEAYPVISTVVTAFLRTIGGDADAAAWLPPPDATGLAWEAG